MWGIPNIRTDEILIYSRKSQSDDPTMPVEEVLAKHEQMLNDYISRNFPGQPTIAESDRYREVVSGETIAHRPRLQELLRRIESPRVKALLIVEPQRLSRGDLEDIGRLVKLLRYTDTIVLTLQYAYDLSDERDRDSFERELKRGNEYLEYTKKILKNGRMASLAAGNFLGSIPPYGYDKVTMMDGKRRCHTLAINKEQADVVRLVFDLYVNKHMGRGAICNYLDSIGAKPAKGDHWSTAWIQTMLQNVHYIGKVRWEWRKTTPVVEGGEITMTRPRVKLEDQLIFDGKHEPIVSEEIFYAAQKRVGHNPRVKSTVKLRNPLAGVMFCECGRAMIYHPGAKARGIADRFACAGQKHCKSGSCTVDDLMDKVIEILEQSIEDFEVHVKNNDGEAAKLHANMIENLEKRLESIQAKELAQWDMQADPDPTKRMPAEIFQKLSAKLAQEKEETKQALQHARETMPETVDYEEKVIRFRELLAALKEPSKEASHKNQLVKACIERIVYHRAPSERGRVSEEYAPHVSWYSSPIELDVTLKI